MFVDCNGLPDRHEVSCDVCIIGAGAAGITIARQLRDAGLSVALLESGGLSLDPRTEALNDGKNTGAEYFYLRSTRMRFFGGTTNHWTGWCRPFDPIDFEQRPWVPESGWPLSYSDLRGYYERAHALLELGPFEYAPGVWADAARAPLWTGVTEPDLTTTIWQFSKPTRFGVHYRADLEQARHVTVYLHATAVELEADTHGLRVARLRVGRFDRDPIFFRASAFVVAAGGIENARLLLASEERHRGAFGNHRGLVGRFFMEHPHSCVGKARLAVDDESAKLYQQVNDLDLEGPVAVRAGLALSEQKQRDERLYGFSATFEPTPELPPGKVLTEGVDELVTSLYRRGARTYDITARVEQAPDPRSRIVLGEARDELGMRRVEVSWKLDDGTLRSMRRGVELVASVLGRAGIGRVYSFVHSGDPPRPGRYPEITGGHHHMGTTRMSADPARGVVDERCRVHGMENLYVAGSSVFPTGGYANPTLTLVALSLRLAHTLEKEHLY